MNVRNYGEEDVFKKPYPVQPIEGTTFCVIGIEQGLSKSGLAKIKNVLAKKFPDFNVKEIRMSKDKAVEMQNTMKAAVKEFKAINKSITQRLSGSDSPKKQSSSFIKDCEPSKSKGTSSSSQTNVTQPSPMSSATLDSFEEMMDESEDIKTHAGLTVGSCVFAKFMGKTSCIYWPAKILEVPDYPEGIWTVVYLIDGLVHELTLYDIIPAFTLKVGQKVQQLNYKISVDERTREVEKVPELSPDVCYILNLCMFDRKINFRNVSLTEKQADEARKNLGGLWNPPTLRKVII